MSDKLKRSIHQQNLAMELVSSPLHHTQDRRGRLTEEEEQMACLERFLTAEVRRKMPPGLRDLLSEKLMEQFGPSFDVFVDQLMLNIMLQLYMPRCEYSEEKHHFLHLDGVRAYEPAEQELVVDMMLKFMLRGVQRGSSANVVDALVKKMALAFSEIADPEDKLTVDMHNMSLAQPQQDCLVPKGMIGLENASA